MSETGALNVFVELHPTSCGACGVIFALTTAFYDSLHTDEQATFYCPNGHVLDYPTTANDDELERLRLLAALDQAEAAGRSRGRRRAR